MMSRIIERTAHLLLSTACLAGTAAANAQTIPMERTPSGHYTVQVEIGDTGAHTFILDTGASHTAIAQEAAEALGFVSHWENIDNVQALTERFDAERFAVEDLEVIGLPPVDLLTVVIPETPEEQNTVAGLIGADAFPDRQFSIDFTDAELIIHDDIALHPDGVYDPVRRLLFATAVLGRGSEPINVLIDSGSHQTLVNPAMRAYVNRHWYSVRLNVSGVSGRIVREVESVAMRGMQIGGVCFSRVDGALADLDVFHGMGWTGQPSIILGLDVLSAVELTVDRDAGVFEFGPGGDNQECRNDRVQRTHIDNEAM